MVDVFISYARANRDMVRRLAEAIGRLGYVVWWDEELPAHLSYGTVITEKIGEAKATLVVWSAESAASEWVRAEADMARNQKTLIQTEGGHQIILDDSPAGGITLQTSGGQKIEMTPTGIVIDNGLGAKIELQAVQAKVSGTMVQVG